MDVCLLWLFCVVRYRSQRWADQSYRGVLPTVVRRCVWSRNLVKEEATGHWGLSVSVLCCQVQVSAMSWLVVQRSPTDCGASLCVI